MKPLVIFDLETTGLDKTKDQIIQFAAIKVDRESNQVIDSKNLYIQPIGSYQITIQAYFKHGIKVDFLKDKPHFSEVAQEIIDFMKDCDILTYNGSSFDVPFLISEFARNGIEYSFKDVDCYDAFLEEKRRNGNNLEDTYKRYKGKSMTESGLTAHDALSDVKATYTVFYAQQKAQPYGPEQIITEDNTINLQTFQDQIVPCFNIGKYKGISLEFVKSIDKQYLGWCISDKCNFVESTKEYIKNFLAE